MCGAIWTNTFPGALLRFLPEESLADFDTIYGDLAAQLAYEVGSPTRIGIQKAYGYAQQKMLIAGTCIMVLSFGWVCLIRNINVAKIAQTKGTVF